MTFPNNTYAQAALSFVSATFLSASALAGPQAETQADPEAKVESPTHWFTEVAQEAGVVWSHHSDRSDKLRFPEIMGGGVGLLDYDGDGDLDLYLVQSGILDAPDPEAKEAAPRPGNKLFRNDSSDGKWSFVDVTDEAGVGDTRYGMGVACADFDRDGDVDMYVTNVGPNVMYVNNGNGTFTDKSAKLKVGDGRWGTSAAFFDADGKNGLDLYVVNNLSWSNVIETPCVNYYGEPDYCSPNNYNAASVDVLYTFGRLGYTDATVRSGIEAGIGNGLGLSVGDFDNDGDVDIYVANDATANVLWANDGKGKFQDVGLTMGCAVNGDGAAEAGMGVQFIDMNSDGYLDLYMTHLRKETNTFYKNLGNGKFSDKTNTTGTNRASLDRTGFGMGFHDFNHDGVVDLLVANGAVQAWKEHERYSEEDAYAEPNQLFMGEQRKSGVRLKLVQKEGATASPIIGTSRGAAFGDLDGDGDVDAVIVDLDANVELLRNDAPSDVSNWVGFSLKETYRGKDLDAHGARVSIAGLKDGRRQERAGERCYSYLSSNDPRVHFGLGFGAKAVDVRVRWRDGTVQTFGDLEAGQYHELKRAK